MGHRLHERRSVLTSNRGCFLLLLAGLLAGGCRPDIFDESCYVRSAREVDWDDVHDDVGFSASDVLESLPEAIYYKVSPGPGLALPFGQRGADWSLEMRPIAGSPPILRRFHSIPRIQGRGCVWTPRVPVGEYQFRIPMHFEWTRLDGGWSLTSDGLLSTSEPWTDDFFHRRPTMSIETTAGWWPAEVPPEALEAAEQELINEEAGPEHFPVEALTSNQGGGITRIVTRFATIDGYFLSRLFWSFELHATVPPEYWP